MPLLQVFGNRLKASGTTIRQALPPFAGGGGGETLIETVTLDNFSGASRTDPFITFARNFVEGEVPSGSFVELRHGGSAITLQQADGRAYHSDGSLKRAIFSCKPPSGAVADNATLDIALYSKSGSFSNSSSIARSTLTAQNYRMRVRIGGVDYWCVLNNLDTAGTFRERRVGNTVRAWEHWGVFRQGTGAADTDQGQLQGKFYSYVWSDGTITVWAHVINGRVANGQAYTVEALELLNGAASLALHTTSFTFYAHTAAFLCEPTDGLPHWSANPTLFWPRLPMARWHATKLGHYIQSSATMRGAVVAETATAYTPTNEQTYAGSYIDAGGPSNWIGHQTTWDARLLVVNDDATISSATRKALWRSARLHALVQGRLAFCWYVRQESGQPPVLVNQDYTANGLTAAQPSIGWGSSETITDTGGEPSAGAQNASHWPAWAWGQWAITGWEWWLDHMLISAIGITGSEDPNTGQVYTRRPTLAGTTYDCGHFKIGTTPRQTYWRVREFQDADWTMPDDHPCKAYFGQVITNGRTIMNACFSGAFYTTEQQALGVLIEIDYGSMGRIGTQPWGEMYAVGVIALGVRRGQIPSNHVLITEHLNKQMLGAVNACPYHAMWFYARSFRTGASPTISSPIAQTWNDVYGSYSSTNPVDQTVKLISDAGGASGTCPSSGSADVYTAGHSYAQLTHGAFEVASDAGLTAANTSLTYLRNLETASGVAETAWANQPQWRIRAAP